MDSFNEASSGGTPLSQLGPLSAERGEIVKRFPSLVCHQLHDAKSVRGRTVDLLNPYILSGRSIPSTSHWKISRKWVAAEISTTVGTAQQMLASILTDYEAAAGIGKRLTSLLPEIRCWLEDGLRSGTIELQAGKVSRRQIFQKFDLNAYTLHRTPDLRSLLQEFDERIATTGYMGLRTAHRGLRLAQLLETPPLTASRPYINKGVLAEALGVPTYMLRESPYLEMIDEAQRKITRSFERNPLVAHVSGRAKDFSDLLDLGWSAVFIRRLCVAFETLFRSANAEKVHRHHFVLMQFLSYLGSSQSSACRAARDDLNRSRVSGSAAWVVATTHEYRDHLSTRYAKVSTRNGAVKTTNVLLKSFADQGVLPRREFPIRPFRDDEPQHLRSVAEALPITPESPSHVDDYLHFATSMLEQAASGHDLQISVEETSEFTQVLRLELEAASQTESEGPAQVILTILNRRLDRIKEIACEVAEAEQRHWEEGQRLLKLGRDALSDRSHLRQILASGSMSKEMLNAYFPVGEVPPETGIANVLALVADQYDYVAHNLQRGGSRSPLRWRLREYGGATMLQRYLSPSSMALSAVITVYLVESGSPVSVGRGLYVDALEDADDKLKKITGYKSRARGKPIFAVINQNSPVVRYFNWVQDAVTIIAPFVASEDSSQLFVTRAKGPGFKQIEEWTFRHNFRAMLERDPQLAKLGISPNMIRPSVLLKAALEADGRTHTSIAIGQHGQGVNNGYSDKYPRRLLHDTEIRLYMNSLQTVVVHKLAAVQKWLGITIEGAARRVEALAKTGLGTFCKDPTGRPGNGGSPCGALDCWNNCPQLIVIAREEDIALLQIWRCSLRAVEGEWLRDHPERWIEVWLPWICFVDAVEVKMKIAYSSIWRAASALAAEIMAKPTFKLMRPF